MELNYTKIFDLAIKILVLLVLLVTVKANIDRANSFTEAAIGQHYEINSDGISNDLFLKSDPRKIISQQLTYQNDEILLMNDRSCGIEGSLENRKRLRWVFKMGEYKLYKYLYDNVSNIAPYYFMIIFYSVFLLVSLIIIGRVVPINLPQYFVFLCGLLYIFQFQLSEISYSILEMFFISLALYSSYKKNILLLIITVIFAIHTRESGVLLPFFWLIFNRSLIPVIISLVFSVGIWLGVSNFDIINCVFSNNFLISTQPQIGQIGFWSLSNGSLSYIALIRLIFEGVLIPIFASFFLYHSCSLYNKNKLIIAILIYLLIFVLATPLLHHSVRILLIPFLVILSSKHFLRSELSNNNSKYAS